MTAEEQAAFDTLTKRASDLETRLAEFDGIKARLAVSKKTADELRAQIAAGNADLQARLDSEIKAHAATKTKLAEVEARGVNAASRAAENLAARGIGPVQKDTPAALDMLAGGEAALWDSYLSATPLRQAEMRAELGDKLTRAAEACDRR